MMVYLHELFAEVRKFLYWTVAICVLTIFFMAFRPLLAQSEEFFVPYMQSMPPEFIVAFGIDVSTMFEPIGYYVFIANFILLGGVVMAATIAISIFSREKRASASDFLFTRPIGKIKLFAMKFAAGFTLLFLFAIAYYITIYVIYTDEVSRAVQFNIVAGFFITQILFYVVGILLSILLRRVRSVAGLASVVGFIGYILTMMNNTLGMNLRLFSPMQYFDVGHMAQHGGYEIGYSIFAVLLVIGLTAGAVYLYSTKDIKG